MKKIAFLLILLVVAVAGWGSMIVVYASSSHAASLPPTPTSVSSVPTPHTRTIVDNLATVAPTVKNKEERTSAPVSPISQLRSPLTY